MNVIVVMLDSLRTDHLSAYAGERAKARTPHMDCFTAAAQVYERMYVGSYPTLPCRRDLFTGRWGHPFNTWGEMERDRPTLAGRLRSAGYVTGLVHDTPMLAGAELYPESVLPVDRQLGPPRTVGSTGLLRRRTVR